jgi:hypothetical protein
LREDGLVIIQIHPKEYAPVPLQSLELIDERRYGSTMLLFYAHKSAGASVSKEGHEEAPCP